MVPELGDNMGPSAGHAGNERAVPFQDGELLVQRRVL